MPASLLPRLLLLGSAFGCLCVRTGWAQTTATLTGTVVNSITRQPIARVLVESPTGGPGVLTDNAGRFSFAGVPAGSTQLRYHRPGYFDPQTEQSEAFAAITVAADSPEQTLVLEPAANLHGRVAFTDGDSAAGVRVMLLGEHVVGGRRRWQPRENALVRADSSFAFENLRPGNYLVRAEASLDPAPPDAPAGVRSGYPPVYAPDAKDTATASIYALRPGQTGESRLRMARAPFFPVKVRVAGEAQGQFTVNGNGFRDWNARFSRDDGAIMTELPVGSYTLTGRSYGRDPEMGELPLRVTGAGLTGVMTMSSSAPWQLEQMDSAPGAGGASGILLTLTPVAAEGDEQTLFFTPGMQTGGEGSRLTRVLGQYWVSARNTGGGYIAALSSGGADLLTQPLTLTPGQGGTIRATVAHDSGAVTVTREGDALAQPCSLQLIPLSPAGIAQLQSSPANQSSAVFKDLAPGDYLVLATRSREEIPFREPGVLQELKGVRVSVEAGGTAQATVSGLFAPTGVL